MEWISVEDRLPDEQKDYLIITNKKIIYAASWENIGYKKDIFMWDIRCECCDCDSNLFRQDFVTHWMPLPNPPKEE